MVGNILKLTFPSIFYKLILKNKISFLALAFLLEPLCDVENHADAGNQISKPKSIAVSKYKKAKSS
jgi:hypothetical protein